MTTKRGLGEGRRADLLTVCTFVTLADLRSLPLLPHPTRSHTLPLSAQKHHQAVGSSAYLTLSPQASFGVLHPTPMYDPPRGEHHDVLLRSRLGANTDNGVYARNILLATQW